MSRSITVCKPNIVTALWLAAWASSAGSGSAQPSATLSTSATTDWREDYAYNLGLQAFTYGFPWVYLPQIRWQFVTQPVNPEFVPYAPLNQFWHARQLMNATFRGGGSPNNDTMYSMAWVDLSKEPLILSVPAITNRYYTFEMASMDSDNFAYVGTRATGTEAGHYAIIGPNWQGTLPEGVQAVQPPSRTPYALIVGRTLVFGSDDVTNVHQIQDQYKLTPLSYWDKPGETPPVSRDVWAPFDPATDPLAAWKTMNRAMTENPPNVPSQQSMLNYFAHIGVGPNQDVELMDASTKRGLARAAQDSMVFFRNVLAAGLGKKVNGWTYPMPTLGRAGQYDDFLTRATFQCWAGIVTVDPYEGTYLNTRVDDEGIPFTGANSYTIRFPAGGLPDVDAFWSITMYGRDFNFVDNRIGRYKLGTYPEGAMQPDPDGGLTIYVQNLSPGQERLSNWLPAPTNGFYLIMRTYLPGPDILNQQWTPPPVAKLPALRLQIINGAPNLTWKASRGLRFQVQSATQILPDGSTPWTPVSDEITSPDGNYQWTGEDSAPARFYRLELLP